jgi:hypothetical protein
LETEKLDLAIGEFTNILKLALPEEGPFTGIE